MASSQQKPKKVAGTRNSDRRNGKASKNRADWNAMEKTNGSWGPRVACKPKSPTGRTIMGYSKKRFEAMAKTRGMSVDGLIFVMKADREHKRYTTKANRAALRNLIKGADKLYRDGTLKHGPTPVLGKHNSGSVNVGVTES